MLRVGAAHLINRVIRRASTSVNVARSAALLRNQCDLLIGYHLAPSSDALRNGEDRLLVSVAHRVHSFLDVGANVGAWTSRLLELAPTAQGIAIEPGPAAAQRLRERLPANVDILEVAAGAVPGTTTFYEQPGAGEHSSLIASHVGESTTHVVEVVTIDALLDRLGWKSVDLVKIDTEGFDGHVLTGARRALQEQRLSVIQFEYNRPWAQANSTLAGALSLLAMAGYTTYVIRTDGIEVYDYDAFHEFFSYANFVSVAPAAFEWCRP